MNAPDYTHGYLRVPLAVWEAIYCRAPLTRRQLQIVSYVLRQSWGWQTKGRQVYTWTRPLTPRQLAEATGLSTDHLTRDLRALIARGVLREREERYQFVPEVRLWKTSPSPAPKARPPAPKCPADAAKTALRPLASKIAKISQRNVPPPVEKRLSTGGDKSGPTDPTDETGALPRLNRSVLEARFTDEAYAGPLSEEQVGQLRQWVRQAGVAAVWRALQPAFSRGPGPCRARLNDLLSELAERGADSASEPPAKEPHA